MSLPLLAKAIAVIHLGVLFLLTLLALVFLIILKESKGLFFSNQGVQSKKSDQSAVSGHKAYLAKLFFLIGGCSQINIFVFEWLYSDDDTKLSRMARHLT